MNDISFFSIKLIRNRFFPSIPNGNYTRGRFFAFMNLLIEVNDYVWKEEKTDAS